MPVWSAIIVKLATSFLFIYLFILAFSEVSNLIRENPEGLQLIAPILYQDMSGLKPVSLGSDLL